MSASLVGSEMCIRDRTSAARRRLGLRPVSAPIVEARAPAQAVVARFPVSYTHLTLPTICSV
eukprot:4489612-Alexandrium_andersonii.AAC.1